MQLDQLFGGSQDGRLSILYGLPGVKQDVGNVAQGHPISQRYMGVDLGSNFEHLASQERAEAVLRVSAINFVSDPPLGVDIAATTLQEESFPTKHLLYDLSRRSWKIRR